MLSELYEKTKRQLERKFGDVTVVATTGKELKEKEIPVGVVKEVRRLLRSCNARSFQLERFGDRYILWVKKPVHGLKDGFRKHAKWKWQLNFSGNIIRTPLPPLNFL